MTAHPLGATSRDTRSREESSLDDALDLLANELLAIEQALLAGVTEMPNVSVQTANFAVWTEAQLVRAADLLERSHALAAIVTDRMMALRPAFQAHAATTPNEPRSIYLDTLA